MPPPDRDPANPATPQPTPPLVELDDGSAVPPYEQVRAGLATRIASGSLPAGTRLPTVRGLAEQLGLANRTVARAYRELEQAGLVRTLGRGGTVVADGGDPAVERGRRAAQEYVATTRSLGIGPDDAVALVRAQLR